MLSYRTSEQAAYHLLRFFIDWSALIDASYDLRSLTKNIRIEVPSRFMRKIVCRLRLNEVNRQ
nr:MAG TPA: hypothetical protein [Caudoviricetes sp.]